MKPMHEETRETSNQNQISSALKKASIAFGSAQFFFCSNLTIPQPETMAVNILNCMAQWSTENVCERKNGEKKTTGKQQRLYVNCFIRLKDNPIKAVIKFNAQTFSYVTCLHQTKPSYLNPLSAISEIEERFGQRRRFQIDKFSE